VKFLLSLSATLLTCHQCCVDVLSDSALMLEVEPVQYLKVAEQILQVVLDLAVVLSLARKP